MESYPAAATFEPLSASAIIDEVVKGCTVEADARQCRIVVRNESPASLIGHPELLRRAVENVLRNATSLMLRATPTSASRPTLAPRGSPSRCATGTGVPEADIPRLRSHSSELTKPATQRSGGIGLGLSIASRAVRLHHGSPVG